jgi:hypothetical protein
VDEPHGGLTTVHDGDALEHCASSGVDGSP